MKSIRELYRIGTGPSSSHTMGPRCAATMFAKAHPDASSFRVTLYGSLAATGKGHMTDAAILESLTPVAPVDLVWEPTIFLPFHTNGMKFESLDNEGNVTETRVIYSVGGGQIVEEGESELTTPDVYDKNTLTEIMDWCETTGKTYWEYVEMCEGPEIWDFLHEVWATMCAAVERGLDSEGVLPGPLGLTRRAVSYNVRASGYKTNLQSRGLVFSYALAVSEENAAGGVIVTAPPC